MHKETRGPERFGLGLPLTVDGAHVGVIRDLSSSGISFTSTKAYAVGDLVDLLIEHPAPGGDTVQLRAEATVVRAEPARDGYTIGAHLSAPFQE